MGFGLPAAVGAKVAAPNKIVVDIDGDASFSMTAMELATASQYNIGVKVLILNNEFQGMVLQWQGKFLPCFYLSTFIVVRPSQNMYVYLSLLDLFYERRYSHTEMANPDFVKLAEAMGVHAIRCHTAEELPAKMKEFLEYDNNKPVVMECVVEKNEHVFPMVGVCRAISCLVITDSTIGCGWKGSTWVHPPSYVDKQKGINTKDIPCYMPRPLSPRLSPSNHILDPPKVS